MNVDFLIMLIVLYIIKNNNSQYLYHTKNQNQNLSNLFIPMNERKPFLNNTYNHINTLNTKNRDYMYYPNHTSNNFYDFKNTSINNKDTIIKKDNTINAIDKDITITNDNSIINTNKHTNTNKDKDKDSHINKATSKSTNKNSIINNDKSPVIGKNNTPSINLTKDKTIKKSSTINTTDKNIAINNNTNNIKDTNTPISNITKANSKNINKNNILNDDEDHDINKNSNEPILKNKFIKSSTKITNKSTTYNNLYKKDNKININNSFNQLQLSKGEINKDKFNKDKFNKDEFIKNLNPIIQKPITDFKTKVPVLIGSTNITEVFHGKINFSTPIISILKVTNELFITNKSLFPTLTCTNNNNSTLYYEGFLKTQLEYLKGISTKESEITAGSKYYIMCIPFSGSKSLNINDEIINSTNIILQNFTLEINKSTFSIDNHLDEPVKGNKYINFYKSCNLTVKVDCHISLYRKKLIQL